MVWAGVCLDGRADLHVVDRGAVTGVRYRDEVMHPIVRPSAGVVGSEFILITDNAGQHTTRAVMEYLDHKGFNVMEWPEYRIEQNKTLFNVGLQDNSKH